MNLNKFSYSLVILAGLSLAACKDKPAANPAAAAPQAVPVTVEKVATSSASYFDEYPASVTPLNQIELRPQVNGFITGIHFKDGAKVRKGQLLYSIDQQMYEATYQQAVANLAVQEANMIKAQKDADRYHELDKNDAIAKQLVDNADAALAAAQKQVEAAKANIKAVQTNVRYTNITAPFDGTIGISNVKTGSPVSAGQTILNTVSTDDPIAVDIFIDQSQVYRFNKLYQEKNKTSDSTFQLTFGKEKYANPGVISVIDRAVDPATGTIRVRLDFPNRNHLLKPGMYGNLNVKATDANEYVIIPFKAVVEQLGSFFVFVVKEDNTVEQRKIKTGREIGGTIIIEDGLSAGETIVTQGVQKLREGSLIAPQEN
ncbi:efflux RND transporter periplasmic adaptor subunit [Gynurincola endophyticus]|jgi:membrane fusion protein (multidrug efflux system)|uniref:efflux RND transporter periplasmic adaptor subunit n=1 Tax=Gynurincola endophyticus TaxID=2479004 RepID=UPI000F8EB316|nr:efflux RND transporter periplasmic adaptor subunit [Gynurincola endophyticus]